MSLGAHIRRSFSRDGLSSALHAFVSEKPALAKAISLSAASVIAFACSIPTSAQISLDGANHCTATGHLVTSVSCTLPNVTIGDLITVEGSDRNGFAVSVSDNRNGAYTPIYYASDSGDPNYSGMAYFANSAAGSITIVFTLSDSDSWAFLSAQAWKGAAKTSVLDTGAITQQLTDISGTLANANCGAPQLPSRDGELIIAYLVPDYDFSVTPGANYTAIDTPDSTDNPAYPEYWIQTSAQATNGPFTSAADDFTEGCAAFKPFVPPAPGDISTIAGNGYWGNTGDGGLAVDAELEEASGLAIDSQRNVYFADFSANVVRKVLASTGIITTVAGDGTAGYSGDGDSATNAQLNAPSGIALDQAGNLYIADTFNNCIRKLDVSTGIITTVVGTGTAGFSGDGGLATNALISAPMGLAFDSAGTSTCRIREIAGFAKCRFQLGP